MDVTPYKKMLEAARQDLETAMEEREGIDKKISGLKQTIIALTRLCGNEKLSLFGVDQTSLEIALFADGITERCREVMRTAGKDMTPVEVRDQLVALGLDPGKYSNLMASVHRILKRLEESKEIYRITRDDGQIAYAYRRHYRRRFRAALGQGPVTPGT